MRKKLYYLFIYAIFLLSFQFCLRQADLSHPLEKDVFRLERGEYLVKVKVRGMLIGNSLALQLNGQEILRFQGDGERNFETILREGNPYEISLVEPSYRQECTINPQSGVVEKKDIFVDVQCITVRFLVGGTATSTGEGFTVTLSISRGWVGPVETLNITTGQSFWFNTLFQNGDSYYVSVNSQPYGGQCTVTNASGVISGQDVQNVLVHCIPWGYQVVYQSPRGYIGKNQSVKIRIDRSFDPSNCFSSGLGGDMGSGSYSFSTTHLPNDTLTITPTTSWNTGYHTMTISNCYALNNEPPIYWSSTISLNFVVLQDQTHVRYVKPSGNDSLDGLSPENAKKSFALAYNELAAHPGCSTYNDCVILLASGDYLLNQSIELKKGINIFGGYNSNFTDISGLSVLDGRNITCTGETESSPCATLYTTSTLSTPYPKLMNLKIYGPNDTHTTALKFSGKPVDQANYVYLQGGHCSQDNCTTSGLFIGESALTSNLTFGFPLNFVEIQGGDCSGNYCHSTGISIDTSFPEIKINYQDLIERGNSLAAQSKSSVIKLGSLAQGTLVIENSRLVGGVAFETAGIFIDSNNPVQLKINDSEINGGKSRFRHSGIFIASSPATHTINVENSIVYGGDLDSGADASTSAYAIASLEGKANLTLSHNLLMSGRAGDSGRAASVGILTPLITGVVNIFYNHLIPQAGGEQYGIWIQASLPAGYDISYNNFWSTHTAHLATNSSSVLYKSRNSTQLCTEDNSTCILAPGNRNRSPEFRNPYGNPPDFHYVNTPSCDLVQVTHEDKTGVFYFDSDMDGYLRRNPPMDMTRSIGPYEHSGGCY